MKEDTESQIDNFSEKEERIIKRKRSIVLFYIYISVGVFFFFLAAWQWYDLYLMEQGVKEGSLSIVLHNIYWTFGKWGVSAIYFIIGLVLIIMGLRKRKSLFSKEDNKEPIEDEEIESVD